MYTENFIINFKKKKVWQWMLGLWIKSDPNVILQMNSENTIDGT